MENFKFFLTSVIVLLVLVLGGYWAVATIEPGSSHVDRQEKQALEEENAALREEVEELKNELRLLASEGEPVAETPAPTTGTPAPAPTGTFKNQTLINELQELVDEKVQMKVGSKGTRVGTVQTFLNLYNNTTKRIDNDYGKTMKADIAAFQKAVGVTADGEAGPTTFQKMIDWLKKQG